METITIEDFAKIKIQVGEILECTEVENSYKLLKFKIDLGNETRQILSGIKKYYKKEDLIGKKVAVVTNLKTAQLASFDSEGMILTVMVSTHKVKVVEFDKSIKNGSVIS